MNRDDEEENDGIIGTDESPLEEDQSRIAERGESEVETKVEVEIEVPSMPQMSISDVSDKSEVSVSSFSKSPFTVGAESPSCYYGIAHACTAPSTPGLEIAKPNR